MKAVDNDNNNQNPPVDPPTPVVNAAQSATPSDPVSTPTPVPAITPTTASNGNDSKKPLVSFILGLLSLVGWILPIIGIPLSITGLVFGILGVKSAKKGLAIAGIILTSIGLIASLINSAAGVYLALKNMGVSKTTPTVTSNYQVPTQTPQFTTSPTSSTLADFYTNTDENFRIKPPLNWTTDNSGIMGTVVIFLSKDVGPNFRANINIIKTKTSADIESIILATEQEIKKTVPGYVEVSRQKINVNGLDAYLLEGSFVSNGMPVNNYQLIIAKNGSAFAVTATDAKANWDKIKDLLKSSLLTFEFLK